MNIWSLPSVTGVAKSMSYPKEQTLWATTYALTVHQYTKKKEMCTNA